MSLPLYHATHAYVRADTDGLVYLSEETYWEIEPTADDPGVLAPLPDAEPILWLAAKSYMKKEEDESRRRNIQRRSS